MNTLAYKELETSQFLIKQFEESFMNITHSLSDNNQKQQKFTPLFSEVNSDIFYSNNNSCFNNLIQFDLQPHDKSLNKNFNFHFEKENIQYLCADYTKWSNKLAELDELLQCMLQQLNEKRRATSYNNEENQKLNTEVVNDFLIDEKLEEQRFLVDEKKMQMIQVESKINALGSFDINLKEIEDYDTAVKFNNDIHKFESDLYQNLELWDTLMKSIDEMQCSDDSYDVEIMRKSSGDFSLSASSRLSSLKPFQVYLPSQSLTSMEVDSNIVPRFAKTVCEFDSDDSIYLSYNSDRSLLIYEETSPNVYKAKKFNGQVGFVYGENIEFYENEDKFVRAVYPYEGLDNQELTFPVDAIIRLLRKSTKKIRIDGEEWWEGVYENRIGFFPCIFVKEIETSDNDYEGLVSSQYSPTSQTKSSLFDEFSQVAEFKKLHRENSDI